jgi:hypothetical protein
LFRLLCQYAGIEAEIIHGFARGRRSGLLFSSNHTWNAVKIGGQWKLIDVTWGSGYMTFNGRVFVKQQDDSWYMTSPEKFAEDHFPDDPRWTLLPETPVIHEMRQSPFRQRSFIKYRIQSYFPGKGLLSEEKNAVVHFEIRTSDMTRDLQVGPDPFLDTNDYKRPDMVLLLPTQQQANSVQYAYRVEGESPKWIYLVYNNDIVLRYYLKPKGHSNCDH